MKQGANDVVNQMLNYGYGIVFALITGIVRQTGLDAACVFLHAERYNCLSLVCDLMELLRARVMDRVVWKLALEGISDEMYSSDGLDMKLMFLAKISTCGRIN